MPSRTDREIAAELDAYIALLAEEKIRAGLSPSEARRQALIEAGGAIQLNETVRGGRPRAWFDRLIQDVTYGLRLFRRAPGLNLAVVLALGLGIGGSAAMFSVVDAVLLRPLAFSEPDQLVVVLHNGRGPTSPANFIDWRQHNTVFSSVGAAEYWTPNLGGTSDPERLFALLVSPDILPMLGVPAARGRLPLPEASNEVVIADGLWRRVFAADANVLGRPILLNGRPFVIVGIMPPGFAFPQFWATRAELWAPLDLSQRLSQRSGGRSLRVFARLKSDVTLDQARLAMDVQTAALEAQFPGSNRNVTVTPLKELVVGDARQAIVVLFVGVGFVLLVACANVAHLLLARASTREREVALRAALGAGRSRLLRQLLTESLLLAAAGGAFGLLLTVGAIALLKQIGATSIPRAQSIAVDSHVVIFASALTLVTAVLFGLAPALKLSRPDLTAPLRDADRGTSTGRRARRLRQVLIASEVALAVTLLVGAALLLRSFSELRAVDAGWQPDRLLSLVVSVAGTPDAEPGRRPAFYDAVLDRVRAVPGVESASGINHMPLVGDIWGISFWIAGPPLPSPGDIPSAAYREVLPGYFETMQLPIVRGRAFTSADRAGAPGVIIVNEFLAQQFWPGEDAVGQRMKVQPTSDNEWLTVVGVAKNAVRNHWRNTPEEEMYLPMLQQDEFPSYLSVAIRTHGDPAALVPEVRASVRGLSRTAAISDLIVMNDAVALANMGARFLTVLLGAFAGIALILAALGIYGVLSHSISTRRQEISIRIALGASTNRVVTSVLAEGLAVTAAGLALGTAGTFLVREALTGLLFGVTPLDARAIAASVATLLAAAGVACYLPARRASRIDPSRELR
jgi:predicted permease